MPSETLSFNWKGFWNPTLFRKNLTRFWPLWGSYTVLLFFTLPMELLQLADQLRPEYTAADVRSDVLNLLYSTSVCSLIFGVIFGVFAAMALFSYLMDARACQLLHTLPIRREGLYLTNWISGVWFFLAPNLVIALLSTGIGLVCRLPVFPDVWLWFLIQTAVCVFFFCFAVCCAMLTGNILALPALYGILNVLVLGVSALIDVAMQLLLVGYSDFTLSSSIFVRWCTPAYQLFWLLSQCRSYRGGIGEGLYARLYSPVGVICYCIALGAVLMTISVLLYRFRQLERAGDLITVGWLRPVFQYGFGVCAGMTIATILYFNFFQSPRTYIALVVVWSAVGAFAGRMLLKKTLRVFQNGWKGVAVFSVVLLFLLGGAKADLLGYQKWVPDEADVKDAKLYVHCPPWDWANRERFLSTPDEISSVIDWHTELVQHLDELENASYSSIDMWDAEGYETQASHSVTLTYVLTDGTVATRTWEVPVTSETLANPDTYAAKLQTLLNKPSVIWDSYLGRLEISEEQEPVGGWLTRLIKEEEVTPTDIEAGASGDVALSNDTVTVDGVDRVVDDQQLSDEEAKKLWQAVQADIHAGNLGRRYLLEDQERYANCYQTDLVLTFVIKYYANEGKEQKTRTVDIEFNLQKSAKETLAVLDALGYKERLTPSKK